MLNPVSFAVICMNIMVCLHDVNLDEHSCNRLTTADLGVSPTKELWEHHKFKAETLTEPDTFRHVHAKDQNTHWGKGAGEGALQYLCMSRPCPVNPCQNNGVCFQTDAGPVCSCQTGYFGTYCNATDCTSDPSSCSVHSDCTPTSCGRSQCACHAGYEGATCQNIDDCASHGCINGGSCVDEVNGYTCACPNGFDGDFCQYDINECSSNPCVHGNCTDLVYDFSCTCVAGYTGDRCEENIDECVSGPCQNEGSCQDGLNGFQCVCHQTHYGIFCEKYCNNSWSEWSECSASCDFGTRSRGQRVISESGGAPYCPTEANNYEHQPCNSYYCEAYEMPEWTTCTSDLDGFFTKASCYYVVDSGTSFKWSDIFSVCQTTGDGFPARLYDTNDLQMHVFAFLLHKHPNTKIWWPVKYYQVDSGTLDMQWMKDESTPLLPARYPQENKNLAPNEERCLSLRASTMTKDSMPVVGEWQECNSINASQPVQKVLCMTKDRIYADFKMRKATKVRVVDSSQSFSSSTEQSPWYCGLRCRHTDMCIGFNYREASGTCQPLTVKAEMLPDGKLVWANAEFQVYEIDSDAEWKHYSRIY